MRVPVTNTDKAKNLTQIKGECMRKFKVRKEEGKMIKSYVGRIQDFLEARPLENSGC